MDGARLRALRPPGRRLGRADRRRGWRSSAPERVAALHTNARLRAARPGQPLRAAAERGRAGLRRDRRGAGAPARATTCFSRAPRPTPSRSALTDSPGRPRRLARREVPPLVRLRRRRRAALLEGRALRLPHALLGDRHDRLLDAPLRGRGARALAPGRGEKIDGAGRRRRLPRRDRAAAARVGRAPCSPTCAAGPRCRAAATSRPSRSRSCSAATCSPSSESWTRAMPRAERRKRRGGAILAAVIALLAIAAIALLVVRPVRVTGVSQNALEASLARSLGSTAAAALRGGRAGGPVELRRCREGRRARHVPPRRSTAGAAGRRGGPPRRDRRHRRCQRGLRLGPRLHRHPDELSGESTSRRPSGTSGPCFAPIGALAWPRGEGAAEEPAGAAVRRARPAGRRPGGARGVAGARVLRSGAAAGARPSSSTSPSASSAGSRERDDRGDRRGRRPACVRRPVELRFEPEPVARPPRGRAAPVRASTPRARPRSSCRPSWRRALAGAGFYEPEKRAFWPHVTVARVKRERAREGSGRRRRGGYRAVVERRRGRSPRQARTAVRCRPSRSLPFASPASGCRVRRPWPRWSCRRRRRRGEMRWQRRRRT